MGAPLEEVSRTGPLVKRLIHLTEGEPLLLRCYADDLWGKGEEAARLSVEDMDRMKPGFDAYFNEWLSWQEDAWETEGVDRRRVDATLAVLACALGPLTGADLVQLVADVEEGPAVLSMDDLLRPLRRWIMGVGSAESGYVLNHPKIGEYLRERYRAPGTTRKALNCFVDRGRRTLKSLNDGSLPADRTSAYLLQFHACHLMEAGATADDFMALVTDGSREGRGRHGKAPIEGFAGDVRTAWETIRADNNSTAAPQARGRDTLRALSELNAERRQQCSSRTHGGRARGRPNPLAAGVASHEA